jgi:hypothetical protein
MLQLIVASTAVSDHSIPLYFLSAERVFLAACNRQENGINLTVNGRQLEMSSLCQGCIARIMLQVQLNFCNYWAVASSKRKSDLYPYLKKTRRMYPRKSLSLSRAAGKRESRRRDECTHGSHAKVAGMLLENESRGPTP